jgi:tetratricopeptide (TPR) repeat protein
MLTLALGLGFVIMNTAGRPSLEAIRRALAEKRWDDVEHGLRGWLHEHPRDGDAWEMLGGLLFDRGRRDEALAALKRVTPQDRGWANAQTMIGEIAVNEHRLAEAEGCFRRAADGAEKGGEPLKRLVTLLVLERRTAEARSSLRRLFRKTRDPRHLADSILISQFESEIRDLGPEIEDYLRQTPEDPWLRRVWGMYLLAHGRASDALPHLEAAASSFDDDATGRFALAECRMAVGVASRELSILGPRPRRPVAAARWLVLRSRLAEAWGQGEEALRSLEDAVREDPRNAEAHYRLGQTLTHRGSKEARPHLDRALALGLREDELRRELRSMIREGFSPAAMIKVGRLCQEAGMLVEARDWFELAAQGDPRASSLATGVARIAPVDVEPAVALSSPVLKAAARSPLKTAVQVDSTRPPPGSQPEFREIATEVGLDHRYEPGATPKLFIGDTMGGGVGLIDYDGDGRLDVYFVNGCALPYDHGSPPAPNRLFRNRSDGTFEDVTVRAGVAGRGYGMGCTVGDYDNDGHDDLFVTGLDRTVLYHNRGDGTFDDVTARAGVGSSRWTTAAGFGDLDRDGDLDLVVVSYVEADPTRPLECRDRYDRLIHCQPERFPAQLDHLYRNNGNGTFTDVSKEAGIEVADGKGLGLAIADFDADGLLDLFVANDGTPNFLFRNLGRLRFEEVGIASGAGYNGAGLSTASMGVVAEDLNGDGRIDLFHTNFIDQTNTLRLNLGGGQFADRTLAANLAAASRTNTGFGTVALDADNDGLLDLFVANGHTDDQPWFNTPMAQRPQLFLGRERGRYELAGPEASPYFSVPVVGRGVAAGDLDNDGRVDLVVVHRDAPAALLSNRTHGGHWLGARLHGTRSGRTPVGASLTCQAGGRSQVRWLTSGTGYLSSSDPRLWFGLGGSSRIDRLEVHWPSGASQSWQDLPADRILEIREGQDPLTAPSVDPKAG